MQFTQWLSRLLNLFGESVIGLCPGASVFFREKKGELLLDESLDAWEGTLFAMKLSVKGRKLNINHDRPGGPSFSPCWAVVVNIGFVRCEIGFQDSCTFRKADWLEKTAYVLNFIINLASFISWNYVHHWPLACQNVRTYDLVVILAWHNLHVTSHLAVHFYITPIVNHSFLTFTPFLALCVQHWTFAFITYAGTC